MTTFRWRCAGLLLLALLAAAPAEAQRGGGPPGGGGWTCSISATSVVFGSYDVFTPAPTDSTGSVNITCTGGGQHTVSVALSPGQTSSYLPRALMGNGESLIYNLYLDPARTTVWGDGSGGSQLFSGTLNNNSDVQLTVYGRVPPGQDVSAGTYSDTIFAVINW